jgi:hypothetical protein
MIFGIAFCIPTSYTAYALTAGKLSVQAISCNASMLDAMSPTRDPREVQKYVEQNGKPYKYCLSKIDAKKSSIDVFKEIRSRN